MTIGEKIVHLRIVNNISQEEMAKSLNPDNCCRGLPRSGSGAEEIPVRRCIAA